MSPFALCADITLAECNQCITCPIPITHCYALLSKVETPNSRRRMIITLQVSSAPIVSLSVWSFWPGTLISTTYGPGFQIARQTRAEAVGSGSARHFVIPFVKDHGCRHRALVGDEQTRFASCWEPSNTLACIPIVDGFSVNQLDLVRGHILNQTDHLTLSRVETSNNPR